MNFGALLQTAARSAVSDVMASFQGRRVRLAGLSTAALCGAEGIAGATDACTGRVAVRLLAPQAAVNAHPAGVKARARVCSAASATGCSLTCPHVVVPQVKPANQELLEPAAAAQLPPAPRAGANGSAAGGAAATPSPPPPQMPQASRSPLFSAAPREDAHNTAAAAPPGAADAGNAAGADAHGWAGKTHAEAYSWLTDAFLLRVEDEYCAGGSCYGAYADATGAHCARRHGSCAARDLRTFLASAHRRAALPPWWLARADAHDDACFAHAAPCIVGAVERSDMEQKHGRSALLRLRALAEAATGVSVRDGGGMGDDDLEDQDEDEEEDEEDDDDWAEEDEFADGSSMYSSEETEEEEEQEEEDGGEALRVEARLRGLRLHGERAAGAAAPRRCVVVLGGAMFCPGEEDFFVDAFVTAAKRRKLACLPLPLCCEPYSAERDESGAADSAAVAAVLAALPAAAACVLLQAEEVHETALRRCGGAHEALRAWVRAGGTFCCNGDLEALVLLRWLFPEVCEPWDMQGDYYRRTHCALQRGCAAAPPHAALPPSLNAKACMLSHVPPEQQLYAPPRGATAQSRVTLPGFDGEPVQPGMCAVAVAPFGAGRVVFFGDVNTEAETVDAVLQLGAPGAATRRG
jgi:hypothetical protein